jgi:Ca2+-binding EF-hand superfamily protein
MVRRRRNPDLYRNQTDASVFSQATASSYKPSPLGQFGSPRSSPFRRPESPASPSPLRQQTTPLASPFKPARAKAEPRLSESPMSTPTAQSWTPRATVEPTTPQARTTAQHSAPKTMGNGNALSQLQPTQVRTLREGFEILDRDSDGAVNREDVADMLTQLGLPSGQTDVSQFFPPSAPQTMTLAVFLNSLATSLAALSPGTELLSAFSAFDDDDSGQIDMAELRDALLHTAPEPGERALTEAEVDKIMAGFTGRRAFSKSNIGGNGLGKRGEVFRYQEFVNSIAGGNAGHERSSSGDSEDS